ncbi:MAG: DUF4340 domain-containing protein [Thermoguttaceae bacterium]
MPESNKTLIFVAIAVVLCAAAYFLQPAPINDSPDQIVGKDLFEKFTDPLEIKTLEIQKINPKNGELDKFKVAELNGRWVIPSHDNYPSDAQNQMEQVANSLIGLQVLSVVAENAEKGVNASGTGTKTESLNSVFSTFGVVDPTASDATSSSGVGVKISCWGENDKELASLIIGKEVETNPELRYVRIPEQPHIYVVKISPSKLSTNFEDWIQRNLLDIQTMDVSKIEIKDYALDIDFTNGDISRQHRGEFQLDYNSSEPAGKRWNLGSMKMERGGNLMDVPLSENEEISDKALTEMVDALDDLKIVNVFRKQGFLASPLRESKPLNMEMIEKEPKIFESLAMRGFYFLSEQTNDDSKQENVNIYSSNGEVYIMMKNGVKYILRFGRLAGLPGESQKNEQDGTTQVSVNRYLFILTEFDESIIAKPELLPLPEVPAEGAEGVDEAAIADAKAKLEEVEKLNARLIDRYQEETEAGKQVSEALNKRFADWFYVVADDVFKKVRPGYDTIIAPKTDNTSSTIDLTPEYHEFPDLNEFPEIKELNAPTLPGQEGMFPAIPVSDEPEPKTEPEQKPESELKNEPEQKSEPAPETELHAEPNPTSESVNVEPAAENAQEHEASSEAEENNEQPAEQAVEENE